MGAASFVQPWASDEFTKSFANRLTLSVDELPILVEMCSTAKPVRRRQDIITEGRRSRTLFIVLNGLLIRYRIMRDGHRQVINVIVPGDIAGNPGCFFDSALYSVRTLTNSVVVPVAVETLSSLLDSQPRLVAKLFWLFSCDTAVCAEHVVVVGRRSARERIAHFFLELLTRLQAVGLADETSFAMPFSQDVICDALGLSLAYVNRELRSLASEGLVTFSERRVTVNDVTSLSELVDFERHYLRPTPASEFFALRRPSWEAAPTDDVRALDRLGAAGHP